jgi:hypothetical protein
MLVNASRVLNSVTLRTCEAVETLLISERRPHSACASYGEVKQQSWN